MIVILADVWAKYDQGNWITILTNGVLKSNGDAVMGRGTALQAKKRFPSLPARLGRLLKEYGNIPQPLQDLRLITFPTKYHWRARSSLDLIEESCQRLVEGMKLLDLEHLYMPRPGCGNGGLEWEVVKPILEKYLDDKYIISIWDFKE